MKKLYLIILTLIFFASSSLEGVDFFKKMLSKATAKKTIPAIKKYLNEEDAVKNILSSDLLSKITSYSKRQRIINKIPLALLISITAHRLFDSFKEVKREHKTYIEKLESAEKNYKDGINAIKKINIMDLAHNGSRYQENFENKKTINHKTRLIETIIDYRIEELEKTEKNKEKLELKPSERQSLTQKWGFIPMRLNALMSKNSFPKLKGSLLKNIEEYDVAIKNLLSSKKIKSDTIIYFEWQKLKEQLVNLINKTEVLSYNNVLKTLPDEIKKSIEDYSNNLKLLLNKENKSIQESVEIIKEIYNKWVYVANTLNQNQPNSASFELKNKYITEYKNYLNENKNIFNDDELKLLDPDSDISELISKFESKKNEYNEFSSFYVDIYVDRLVADYDLIIKTLHKKHLIDKQNFPKNPELKTYIKTLKERNTLPKFLPEYDNRVTLINKTIFGLLAFSGLALAYYIPSSFNKLPLLKPFADYEIKIKTLNELYQGTDQPIMTSLLKNINQNLGQEITKFPFSLFKLSLKSKINTIGKLWN